MDTNLRSTDPGEHLRSRPSNTFKGLISWLCLLVILCAVSLLFVFAVMVIVSPGVTEYATDSVHQFAGSVPPHPVEAPDGSFREAEAGNADLAYEYGVKIASAVAVFLTALILVFAFRQDRRAFEAVVARWLGWIWMEVKLLVIGGYGVFFIAATDSRAPALIFTAGVLGVLLLYLLCLDVGRNRRFFGHNIIHSVLLRINDFHSMTTFQQRALRRAYSVIGVAAALAVFGLAGYGVLVNILPVPHRDKLAVTVPAAAIIGIVGTVWWYILSLKRDLRDWNLLMDQITEMYGGNLDAVNHVPPTSNLYDCAMQLNMIRTGVQKAVEEGTKADRTKIELITNVSHDIKTPLTSVISYVELLKKEELTPAARDYVEILSGKTQRLSVIVQDVFEVSKAATGNISLNLEDLDIGRLLKQTFAEMEEVIGRSKLQFRVDIPETPMVVHADGQRMYRVFQNLIRNCTQYSLPGSRVYVSLVAQSGVASVSIRNVSKTEITMNGEDLTARFVRGDQNRTTEGSGLGLSIAKSFTEACGGRFFVRTDGDLFVATVQFPLTGDSLVGGEPIRLQV